VRQALPPLQWLGRASLLLPMLRPSERELLASASAAAQLGSLLQAADLPRSAHPA
jgi:hypothetical protein